MATGVVVVFGILWIPIMKIMSERQRGLYDYLQNVQGFLAPPITAVFLLGLFNKRINGHGAFWGMVIGFLLGMFKLTCRRLVQSGAMAPTGFFGSIGAFNGYYFTGVLFAISIILVDGDLAAHAGTGGSADRRVSRTSRFRSSSTGTPGHRSGSATSWAPYSWCWW